MQNIELTDEDLKLINSKVGLYNLFKNKKINLEKVLADTRHEHKIKSLQEELIKLQHWIIEHGKRLVVVFEGRDAAGKGGAIRRITEYINPRHFRVVALNIPTEDEREQWFFQRYITQLPKPGEIVFFDRSWYNRAVVEPVNGFCTDHEYNVFMNQVNDFERMLVESDTYLLKIYFSINKEEQAKRFADIRKSPLKKWKITPVDEKAQELWDVYTKYKQDMFDKTNTDYAPWKIINANRKGTARSEAMEHILSSVPYNK